MTKESKICVTARDILAVTANCIIKQSPYPIVYNLVEILEEVRQHLVTLGFKDELEFVDKYHTDLYVMKTDDEIVSICNSLKSIPSIDKLNITKVEEYKGISKSNDPNRSVKFIETGLGLHNRRDRDFIDLDALVGNIRSALLNNIKDE